MQPRFTFDSQLKIALCSNELFLEVISWIFWLFPDSQQETTTPIPYVSRYFLTI